MAHLISEASGRAEAFYALKPAWHGLGTVLDHAPDSATAIEAAGLNWRVDPLPLVARRSVDTPEGIAIDDTDVPGFVANVRSDTGDILGVVGSSYRIVQNSEAFGFLDSLLQDGVMRYESAGALKGGRIVWMLARMPSVDTIAAGDDSRRYVLFTTAHDGTGAIRALPTSVRVVCWNTLSIAMKSKDSAVIRHTGDIDTKLSIARRYLSQFDQAFTLHSDTARRLADRRYTFDQLESYLSRLFPEVEEKRAKTIRERDIESVRLNLINPRNTVGNIAGTWWSAVNAVTELVDHASTTRGQSPREKSENRMMANFGLHGRAAQFKREAFDVAAELAGIA